MYSQSQVTIDDMFPRAEPMLRVPLPLLKVSQTYALIEQRAKDLELKLTAQHRDVIEFVLDFYEYCDDCENARALADLVHEEFIFQGGRRYLYKLFPAGPLNTIHYLADLPALKYETDPSSGIRF
ncbi:sulfur relay protein, TusE/DsrC/DsvC family [Thiothrix eikelboomii]|uniref:Sulfur relay protein, TusE/DsrC/DsvC family n=2 Tax=Thiothrix eikelboomii TaxID=92487 RepID=A0A1T4W4J6_9GAMM|nr:sulfur relay protein, TusE/DsrC/DsvC family [Thiothrix eikelboomii]